MHVKLAPIVLIITTLVSFGGEPPKPYTGSAEFEKMKTLTGTWKATVDMGGGPMPVTAQYRVVSGGSAIEERLFSDSPNEMVTIYHDGKDGKLALTHYCMLCNRPAMTLVKAEGRSLEFDLVKDSEIKVDSEKHMHAVTLTLDDADHLTHDWTLFEDGKAKDRHPFKFERVKP